MNKGSKNTFGIAICLLITGVICLVVSVPFGGLRKAVTIMEGRNVKIFGLNGLISTLSFDKDSLEIETGISTSNTVSNGEKTKICDGKDIKTLNIEVEGARIIVEDSKDSDYYVESAENIIVSSDVSGSKLHIEIEHNGSYSSKSDKYKVTLYIPEDNKYDDIKMAIGACDFSCDPEIECDKFDLKLGAGNMKFDKLNADDAKIEVGAGKIEFEKFVAKNADIDVGAGDFEMKGDIKGDLNLNCAMGNASLDLDSKEKDHDYSYKVGMGNLNAGSVKIKGMGERSADNGNSSKYNIDLGMGNVDIDFD